MKPEMITLKVGDATIKLPASTVAQLALASVISQVVPPHISAANAPSVTGIPALGAYWPGEGGVNAGLMRGIDGSRDYYLIVTTGDDLGELKFGGYGEDINGAGSASDGLANTQALVASEHKHPAALACVKFSADGKDDFYLPARRELQLAEANVPEVFAKGWHWSSSQRSAYIAFIQHFGDGGQGLNDKNVEFRVRPVRRLFI
ncbi:DUF1566 domain-containing protein [Pseudomonas ficuserectae]|uniref:DUF1566 domain-containing protein n=1 Tax=Pseudomonas amygdali pv. lachrymans str. M301315 TaxID=629260 RepID=A0AAD0LX52_PSEAV|nr:DUF1566 domain-containing protein [Pseudomonas amygdali]AXH55449.1 DUF1566 domain-containing protein [Pseudomonas amygdali pv. lachrymans str. M301315]AXH55575.1 DUF1566 domain-containing protein [Pseudomonas amygdali pv. lachrymans str. M301315]QWA48583.1 DUF1566 domain-containing protein [Pseudomonas amygdali pv. lachrymans]WIO56179.1 DUF1566 domain-containing protein [Pseudomonas amygdali pv. lachrymans]WIO59985.1 DUF1566 domain-containing protein [Pseudomonas amygdali pv. lachrymans]